MTLFKKNNEITNGDDSIREIQQTYEEYGYECCVEKKGDISSYILHLATIFSGHIISEKDKKDDHSEKIKPILDKIRRAEQDIEDLDIKKNELIPGQIKLDENKLIDKKNELRDLENNPPKETENFSMFKYVNLSCLIILLTGSILYFYANIGWVLWAIPDMQTRALRACSPSVFNSISELLGEGICNKSANIGSFILPIVFLAFAFILHLFALEKNSLIKYIKMIFLTIVILALDIYLAVGFEMKIANYEGQFGFTNPGPDGFFNQLNYVIELLLFLQRLIHFENLIFLFGYSE